MSSFAYYVLGSCYPGPDSSQKETIGDYRMFLAKRFQYIILAPAALFVPDVLIPIGNVMRCRT